MERHKEAGERQADHRSAVSPELAAAQRKLVQVQQAFRANQIERPSSEPAHGRFQSPDFPKVHTPRPNSPAESSPTTLPAHLGWHSQAVTRAYRQTHGWGAALCPPTPTPDDSQNGRHRDTDGQGNHKGAPLQDQAESNNTGRGVALCPPRQGETVRVPPDIALAILRRKLAAPGRIWLLLRHIDSDGRGWLTAETARQQLTRAQSPLRVCGPRQLRNLLAAGDNIFWERDKERIWLKSLAKTAVSLGLSHLNGRTVQLPLPILLQSIGTVRAHLYATFHSSRNKAAPDNKPPQSRPISRKTLKKLTAASRRTQRLYEKLASVRQKTNYALGPGHTAEKEQRAAWQLGRAYFRFHDKKGLVGQAGQSYLAWQLPNSYTGPHDIDSKSHRRRLNRQLTDLLTIGITGNGETAAAKSAVLTSEAADGYQKKMFYQDSGSAAKVYNRQPEQDMYWRSRLSGNGRCRLWHALPALQAQPVDNSK